MRDADGQRLQLKSKLLAGAAGMTAAALSTAAFAADAAPPPAADASAAPAPAPIAAPAATPAQAMTPIDPPKWLPYVDISGGAGSGFAIGRANAFVPFWQDLDSLAFVRFGADTGVRHSNGDFNIGLGYRTKLDDEWILGGFAGFDSTQTPNNHTFNQFSFGLEAMSADWDIRANAYFAKKTNRAIGNKFELYIHDTTIAILQAQEAAMSGFDGEIGYRVFNTDSTDVRVFAGAYTFHHADVNTAGIGTNFSFPYHDVTGPKLRAEVNVFDLDMLGSQSRFSVEGQVSHDSVYHTSEYIGATLRIALNDPSGSGAQALDDLDRRMADPVRRQDNVLTQWHFNKPEPVIIYNGAITSKPTNTLFYADQQSGAGAGSYADQTTIQDATSRGGAGKNAFIVLTDAGGSAIDSTGTTIRSGETLTGAGTFRVRGANSTYPVFTHDFAPGSGHVSLSTTSGNVLNVEGDANIFGLSIAGPFTDGIYGSNVGNVTIAGVHISGPGTNGIVFQQTDTSGTSNIVIKNSSISGVSNDGIELGVSATSGATSTTNLVGSNLTISAGHDGVSVTSNATGSSNATVYAGIHDSTLTAGNVGAEMSGTTSSGGTLTQTLLVDPTTIHVAAGGYGIYVHGDATSGTLTQNVDIADVAITGTPKYGLFIYGEASGAGHLIQGVDVHNLTIAPAGIAVDVVAYGTHGGQINQTVGLTNVVANNASYHGIGVDAYAFSGATVIQTVNINQLQASHVGAEGVHGFVHAYSAASDAPSVAAQYLTVDNATLIDNGFAGIQAFAVAEGNSVAREDLTVEDSTITGNGFGIAVIGISSGGASVQQNIYFANDDLTHNTADGIHLDVYGDAGNGFAAQYGTVYNVDVSYSGHDGVSVNAIANGGDAEQQFYMVGLTADHEGRDGVEIKASASNYTTGSYTTYPSHVEQDLYVIYSDLSHNARNGLEVYDYVSNRAQIDQLVFAYGSSMDDNAKYGFTAEAIVQGPATATYANGEKTFLNANLYIENSTADHNAQTGIYINTSAYGAAVVTEKLTVAGSDVSYNGADGLTDVAYATGYLSENIHYVTLEGSTFDHNDGQGANLIATQYFGPGPYGVSIQIDTIADSDFSNNTGAGVFFGMYASGYNGRAEVYATISGSNFANNAKDGVAAFAYAGGGGYVPGYGCYTVQGTVGYCAVVRESIGIDSSTITDNGRSGIYMASLAQKYGAIYAHSGRSFVPSLYVSNSTISGNPYAGITLFNEQKYFSYSSQLVVLDNTKITGNGTDGTYFIAGPGAHLLQGGIAAGNETSKYSVGQQFIFVQDGSDISGNKGFGISLLNEAFLSLGRTDVLEVYNSSVSGNYGGVLSLDFAFETLGNVVQVFYSYKSHFDNNVGGPTNGPLKYSGSGVSQYMISYEALGVAYQYFGSIGSTFSGNDEAGAFVGVSAGKVGGIIQIVNSTGDTISNNGAVGLAIEMDSKYSNLVPGPSYQTVTVAGDTISGNSDEGLSDRLQLYGGSVVYQTLSVSDTALDHNGSAGLYSNAYVTDGSGLLQSISFYAYSTAASASNNAGTGVDLTVKATGGALVDSTVDIYGVDLSSNGGFGVRNNISYADGSSQVDQENYIYNNTINGNGDGIGLYAIGPGAEQYTFIGNNHVENNAFVGVYGEANFGAYQLVSVYTLGNTVTGNGTNYLFNAFGGATNNIY